MTRTMYDATHATVSAIPLDAQMVAGYVSDHTPNQSIAWTLDDWARFPHAVKVTISGDASISADVLDIESGAASVPDAVPWIQRGRAAGRWPSLYFSLSLWDTIRQQFLQIELPEPPYWIAHYDGQPSIPDGAIAKQYANPPLSGAEYDVSIVADFWRGIDIGVLKRIGPVKFFESTTDNHFHRFYVDVYGTFIEEWLNPDTGAWQQGLTSPGAAPLAGCDAAMIGNVPNVGTVGAAGGSLCFAQFPDKGWVRN